MVMVKKVAITENENKVISLCMYVLFVYTQGHYLLK